MYIVFYESKNDSQMILELMLIDQLQDLSIIQLYPGLLGVKDSENLNNYLNFAFVSLSNPFPLLGCF